MNNPKQDAMALRFEHPRAAGGGSWTIRLLVLLILLGLVVGGMAFTLQWSEGALAPVANVEAPSWDAAKARKMGQKKLASGIPLLRLSGNMEEQTSLRANLDAPFFKVLAERHLKGRYPRLEDDEAARLYAKQCIELLPTDYQDEFSLLSRKLSIPVTELLLIQQSLESASHATQGFLAAQHRLLVRTDQTYGFVRPPSFFHPASGWPLRAEVLRPQSGLTIVSLAPIGMLGVLFGCNEAGICGAVLDGPREEHKPGVPLPLALRAALERGSTLGLAQQALDALPVSGSGTVVLLDSQGGMLAAEIAAKAKSYRYAEKGVLVADERFVNSIWPDAEKSERYLRLEGALGETAWLGLKGFKALVAEVSLPDTADNVLLFNMESAIWWIPGRDGTWEKLRLREFFGKPQ